MSTGGGRLWLFGGRQRAFARAWLKVRELSILARKTGGQKARVNRQQLEDGFCHRALHKELARSEHQSWR